MSNLAPKIDVQSCATRENPHPCDQVQPCDPFDEEEGDCQIPYVCLERLKNPAYPGEITKCMSGSFINVKTCVKIEPPHPCDPLPLCSTTTVKRKKKPCKEPPLCLHRIKNPEKDKGLMDPCDSKQ